MNEHQNVKEHFIRPTARVNNWQPSFQLHGPGAKSCRATMRTDWVRRRAATVVRRENVPRVMNSVRDESRINQRSQSLSALNLMHLTNPENLDFDQKRQILSNHIRASWVVTDPRREVRSCGIFYHLSDKASDPMRDIVQPVDPFESNNYRDKSEKSPDHSQSASETHNQSIRIYEVMQNEQECLHAFYQSLRSEVIPAPVSATLFIRPVQAAAMDKMLLQTIEPNDLWQRVGQGRLVVLAKRESCSPMDVRSIQLQLCQPKTFCPLWSGTIALPKLHGKLSGNKQRSTTQSLNGVLDTTRQLSAMLYNRLADDMHHIHLAFAYNNTPAIASNRGWPRLSTRHRSVPLNGSPTSSLVKAKAAEGREYVICQWRFQSDPQMSSSSTQLLNVFFNNVRDLVDRALIYRFRSRMKRSEPAADQNGDSSSATPSPRRAPMSDRPILKSQISAPCMFRHLTSLKPEDVEHLRGRVNSQFTLKGLQAQ